VALLALALCALPLLAQKAERRVLAPCALTTASVTISGKDSKTEGRQYVVRVFNKSTRTVAFPRTPVFGWRVEILERKAWRLKAEGGPAFRVKNVSTGDPHIEVVGDQSTASLVEIPAAHSEDFYTFLPEADKVLQPGDQPSTLKLTLYWAASAELAQTNHAIPVCALQPEWVVSLQKLPARSAPSAW
jgi:hypothetical protein